jgi:hypothetical protein
MLLVRIAHVVGLAALVATGLARSAETAPLQPFQADYQVLRNGKELGHATLALRAIGDGTWEFSSRTQGTKGMASMLGLDVAEKSTFRWRDGQPQGLSYSYSQDAAIKSRRRNTEFDWNAHEARSSDGKDSWTAPLSGNAMDRNSVTVALMSALKSGASRATFPVVDKDHVGEQRYTVSEREALSLPAGSIEAVRVDRQRDGDSKRTTTSWFAPQRGWLPVQIEQVEKNGETITMRLAATR